MRLKITEQEKRLVWSIVGMLPGYGAYQSYKTSGEIWSGLGAGTILAALIFGIVKLIRWFRGGRLNQSGNEAGQPCNVVRVIAEMKKMERAEKTQKIITNVKPRLKIIGGIMLLSFGLTFLRTFFHRSRFNSGNDFKYFLAWCALLFGITLVGKSSIMAAMQAWRERNGGNVSWTRLVIGIVSLSLGLATCSSYSSGNDLIFFRWCVVLFGILLVLKPAVKALQEIVASPNSDERR